MCATWILMLSLLSFVVNNEALWCTPCTTEILDKCGDNDVKTCKFGVVKDVCKCCDVCAKGPNESCGGPFYMDGRCGEGLNCHPELNPENWYFPGNCTAEQLQPGADEVIKQWETFK